MTSCRTAAMLAAATLVTSGCGSATAAHVQPVASSKPVATPNAAARIEHAELLAIVRRIYDQALHGRNVADARRRLGRSRALGAAVAAHDARATRAALAPLLKHQIIRIEVAAGGRTLARFGHKASFAPVRGAIRAGGRTVGRYVMSVTDDRAFAGIASSLTGARIRFGAGAGPGIAATRFPTGREHIAVTLPPANDAASAPTAADARLLTIASVARRVMAAERSGPKVAYDLRHAAADPAFVRAIATSDPALLRTEIIRFFRANLHVVRVRAWNHGTLVGDVGGPYVLSPATRTLPGGLRFMLAVQDDTGFIKLVHRFTGAAVVLHAGSRTVPGSTLSPGPPYKPGLATTTYRGRSYRSYGFTGTAFPSGPLYVTLLVR